MNGLVSKLFKPQFHDPNIVSSLGYTSGSIVGGGTSLTLASANDALLSAVIPFKTIRVAKLSYTVGAANSGNFDIGIYNAAGVLLASSGSTGWGGNTAEVVVTLATPVTLHKNQLYYLAFAGDNTTGTFRGVSGTTNLIPRDLAGNITTLRVATSFPLPSTITPGTTTSGRVPVIIAREA